ncbi:MAG: hypothetical protein IKA66_07285 [Candidatus Methanomethylophilaceae archaeon]|nr:hypothetical protein [Candidatus Methanomethylophilaceae archaeon]
MGIVSVFQPWCNVGGLTYTGLDFVLGDASAVGSGIQGYIPLVLVIVMAILLFFSVRGLLDRSKGMTCYGYFLFGFVTLLLVVFFGIWSPIHEMKMVELGDMGLYLGYGSCSIIVLSGLFDYMFIVNRKVNI